MTRSKTSKKNSGNDRSRQSPVNEIMQHIMYVTREFYELRNSNVSIFGMLSIISVKLFAYHFITKLNLEKDIRRYARIGRGVNYYFKYFFNLFR